MVVFGTRCLFLALLVTILGLGCEEWQQLSQRVYNPYPGDEASIKRGQGLYAAQGCGLCHGVAGAGDGPQARTTRVLPTVFTDRGWMITRSDPDLFWHIIRGREREGMKAYGDVLSPSEAWDLVNFLRSLY